MRQSISPEALSWPLFVSHRTVQPFHSLYFLYRDADHSSASFLGAMGRALNIAKGEIACLRVELLIWLGVANTHTLTQGSIQKNH
jgi:hypothetical protein